MRFVVTLLALAFSLAGFAQIVNPVTWRHTLEPKNPAVGQTATLVTTMQVAPGWHLYGPDFDPNLGPLLLEIKFEKGKGFEPTGKLLPQGLKREMDEIFGGEVSHWHGTGVVRHKVRITSANPVIAGTYEGQTCTDADGRCVPVSNDFALSITTTETTANTGTIATPTKPPLNTNETPTKHQRKVVLTTYLIDS